MHTIITEEQTKNKNTCAITFPEPPFWALSPVEVRGFNWETTTYLHFSVVWHFFYSSLAVLPWRSLFLMELMCQWLPGVSLLACLERGMLPHSFSTKEVGLDPLELATLLCSGAFQLGNLYQLCDAAGKPVLENQIPSISHLLQQPLQGSMR